MGMGASAPSEFSELLVATTRPDKRPHLTAVWGIWWDEVFYFSTGRLARKSRNLAQNPGCVVSTESAAEAVIVEGVASIISNPEILRRIAKPIGQSMALLIPTIPTSLQYNRRWSLALLRPKRNLQAAQHAGIFKNENSRHFYGQGKDHSELASRS